MTDLHDEEFIGFLLERAAGPHPDVEQTLWTVARAARGKRRRRNTSMVTLTSVILLSAFVITHAHSQRATQLSTSAPRDSAAEFASTTSNTSLKVVVVGVPSASTTTSTATAPDANETTPDTEQATVPTEQSIVPAATSVPVLLTAGAAVIQTPTPVHGKSSPTTKPAKATAPQPSTSVASAAPILQATATTPPAVAPTSSATLVAPGTAQEPDPIGTTPAKSTTTTKSPATTKAPTSTNPPGTTKPPATPAPTTTTTVVVAEESDEELTLTCLSQDVSAKYVGSSVIKFTSRPDGSTLQPFSATFQKVTFSVGSSTCVVTAAVTRGILHLSSAVS